MKFNMKCDLTIMKHFTNIIWKEKEQIVITINFINIKSF